MGCFRSLLTKVVFSHFPGQAPFLSFKNGLLPFLLHLVYSLGTCADLSFRQPNPDSYIHKFQRMLIEKLQQGIRLLVDHLRKAILQTVLVLVGDDPNVVSATELFDYKL